jgi:hypothetical protein
MLVEPSAGEEADEIRGPLGRNQRSGLGVLMVVDRAIDFELPDHEGKPWLLSDQLEQGPVLIVFYRGDW